MTNCSMALTAVIGKRNHELPIKVNAHEDNYLSMKLTAGLSVHLLGDLTALGQIFCRQ